MKILLIEICNFVDYPTGGHLSFARNMLAAFGHELALVGCATDETTPVGCWTRKEIQGVQYDFFAVRRQKKSSRRPLIPARLSGFFHLLRYRKQVLGRPYDMIFMQTPEVLFALPRKVYPKCCLRMPGLENPLRISRYKSARNLAPLFEALLRNRIKDLPCILATAGSLEVADFIRKNRLSTEAVVPFPTRYDERIFHVSDRDLCRRKLGVSDSDKLIVTVGRLAENKGWRLMLEAFAKFHKQAPDSLFFYIGDGEDLEKIKSAIGSLGITECVRLLGRRIPPEIAEHLNAADLFIMGSYVEGWSTTLVEACACGCPIVTTSFSSAADMVENGKNGFIVAHDPEVFAEKIKEALAMSRQEVIAFNQRISHLSVHNLRQAILNISQIQNILKGKS